MRFRKIKWDERQMQLAWSEKDATGEDEIHSRLKSTDAPRNELIEQLQILAGPARVLLELPEDYELTVRAVALDKDTDGNRGVVVSCVHAVEHSNSPFVLHTPRVVEHEDMPQVVRTLIAESEALEGFAKRYVNGQRSQTDMFEDEVAA